MLFRRVNLNEFISGRVMVNLIRLIGKHAQNKWSVNVLSLFSWLSLYDNGMREREGGTVTVFRLSAGNVTEANGLHVSLTLNAIRI